MKNSKLELILKQMAIFLLNMVGVTGILFIIYGVLSYKTGSEWSLLENIANHLAAILTLAGTSVVACSAYFPAHMRRADSHSRYVIAPFTLTLIAITVVRWLYTRILPSPHIVNGFAIMAIAASILRALPFSEWQDREAAIENKNN
jgi:hypothetical protein